MILIQACLLRGKQSQSERRVRWDEESPRAMTASETAADTTTTRSSSDNALPEGSKTPSPRSSSRTIVTLRTSILRRDSRYMSQQPISPTTNTPEESSSSTPPLSRTDIRASPRLTAYLFQLLSSTVLLITVIQFYRLTEDPEAFLDIFQLHDGKEGSDHGMKNHRWEPQRIFNSANGPVYYWKLMGCMAIGALGCGVNLLLLIVHFDTFLLPKLWFAIFRDGSPWERTILYTMALFWTGGLYICTSSLSVGEVQANVFFTCWIAYLSAIVNCGVWRISAGKPSMAEQINQHHRETTYHWCWTLLFAIIFAGSITDYYIHRDDIELRLQGKILDWTTLKQWIQPLAIVWGAVVICVLSLILNHFATLSAQIKLCSGRVQFVVGWRQLEGLVSLGMVGLFFWLVFTETGANGTISGLNNAYFGAWGSFFNALFTLSAWLKENKGIKYVVREDSNRNTASP